MMTTAVKTKARGLGRGLGTLLSNTSFELNAISQPTDNASIVSLPLEALQPGKYQPRQSLSSENLEELAESIRSQGVIQPIIVRPVLAGRYEIIAGERRFRAAKLAGLTVIPVVVREVPDKAAIAMALIENIQREDLNVLEEARALKRLQDEFQLTQAQVAQAVGKSRVAITHALGLLNLPREIQDFLHEGKIERGHAKILVSLPLADQLKIAEKIIENNLFGRETEKLMQSQVLTANNSKTSTKKVSDPNIGALERQLSDKLSTPVIIQHSHTKARGKVIIHYRHLDILDDILKRLN